MNSAARQVGVRATTSATWDLTRSAAASAAAVGVLLGLVRYGPTSQGIVTSCFLGALGAVAVIDFREHVVPVRLVIPAFALVLVLQLLLFPEHALEWILASGLAFAGLLALWLAKRDGIGLGDTTLGLLLGAGLGSDVVMAMFVGLLLLWPVAAYLLLRDGVDARKASVPLAPAFAIGAALVAVAG